MKKNDKGVVFVCGNCGNEFAKWMGQCSACGEWNSLKEVKERGVVKATGRKRETAVVKNLGEKGRETSENTIVFSSLIGEFDRVLGKGFIQGQVVLFAGEPGIGKSTLLTQLLGKLGGLYVAGEESAGQIGLRVKRLGLDAKKFDILETNLIEDIREAIERTNNLYKIVVVDSIQVMATENLAMSPGSVSQIRESTFALVELAKRKGVTIVIVGHVTKEGEIAGPKMLEHMVDTVIYFEGEKNGELRILRSVKNRFGPTDEVGVFRMEERGLMEVSTEEINLSGEGGGTKEGSAVTVLVEGSRPMCVEIQALVTESFGNMPKRVFSGVDYNRGQLLVAVAQKILGLPLYNQDVFVAVGGGIRVEDTGADLAIVGAIFSSYKGKPLRGKTGKKVVLIGEVSLLGDVRKVRFGDKREKEAKALNREVIGISNIRELKDIMK